MTATRRSHAAQARRARTGGLLRSQHQALLIVLQPIVQGGVGQRDAQAAGQGAELARLGQLVGHIDRQRLAARMCNLVAQRRLACVVIVDARRVASSTPTRSATSRAASRPTTTATRSTSSCASTSSASTACSQTSPTPSRRASCSGCRPAAARRARRRSHGGGINMIPSPTGRSPVASDGRVTARLRLVIVVESPPD